MARSHDGTRATHQTTPDVRRSRPLADICGWERKVQFGRTAVWQYLAGSGLTVSGHLYAGADVSRPQGQFDQARGGAWLLRSQLAHAAGPEPATTV